MVNAPKKATAAKAATKKATAAKAATKKATAAKAATKKATAAKAATKKAAAAKAATKKATAAKAATKKAAAAKAAVKSYAELGLIPDPKTGFLVPKDILANFEPVPVTKLQKGMKKAQKEINAMMEQMVKNLKTELHLKEVELSASFSAKGEFLGIGAGGSATIKFKFSPFNK